jgi:Icc-related predicted phosphoesterase
VNVRLAAVGDIHVGVDSTQRLRTAFAHLEEHANLLLLAGDLTRNGEVAEAEVLAEELASLRIPVVAVLGNHDYHQDAEERIVELLHHAGVVVLDGCATVIDVGGERVGVAGTKGFGGGFVGACASEYGEPEMKGFVRHTRELAERLASALAVLRADRRIVLLHYSPVQETLRGEPLEIHPFLGSYLLAEAIDRHGADLVLHGHAHAGSARGRTPGGAPVRNVAQPVLGHAYQLLCLGHVDGDDCEEIVLPGHRLGERLGAGVPEPAR